MPDEENLSVIDKKKNMVKKLVRLELSEKLAKAAVQSVGFEDTDDCLIWALSNAEDIEELSQQFDREMGKSSRNYCSACIRIITGFENQLNYIKICEVIWPAIVSFKRQNRCVSMCCLIIKNF